MHKAVRKWLSEFAGKLTRKKVIGGDLMETPLKRCLGTWDLMLFGIGQMIGGGIYVLSGTVAKDNAGPGIVLSFLIAGFVALLSSLCYAEFAARIPKTGSAYLFGYVTMGEFVGFVIAWQMVLENMIGAASVARAWGGYVDSLLGGVIRNSTLQTLGVKEVYLFGVIYPDFVAFAVCLVACAAVAFGVKHSARLNNVFTLVNLLVILFVIVFGFTLANGSNWTIPGHGFLPYGFEGVLRGAAVCFFAFIGFDSIATAGEESIDPQRSIPIATLTSMSIVTLSYVGVAAALTLMVPYFDINPEAALPDAFAQHDLNWAKYLVALGALSGMTTSLVGSVYSLSRCLYAMASDGLIFEFFSRLNQRTQVPLNAVIVFGFLAALFALLMELHVLVEFLSVGTLLAFTIVSASTIILHYQPKMDFMAEEAKKDYGTITPSTEEAPPTPSKTFAEEQTALAGTLRPSFKFLKFLSDFRPGIMVVVGVVLMALFTGALCSTLIHGLSYLKQGSWWAILLSIIFAIGLAVSFGLIVVHRQNHLNLSFQVPFVPFTPALSIFCNVVLMTNLTNMTWLRFVIWMLIGFLVYFGYGIRHSKENKLMDYSTMMVVGTDDADAVSLDGTIHRPQIDGMKKPDLPQSPLEPSLPVP